MLSRLKDLFWKIYVPWGRVGLIITSLGAVIFLTRLIFLAGPSVAVSSLPVFPLDGYHRLLILAPHCDDETLSSAGLILAAERAGIQVRVVIATNGDGYLFATMQEFRKVYPSHADFIHLGTLRQQESLAALAELGVTPDQVSFLSYPDRGTPALWNTYWSDSFPYRSPYSGDTSSPYPVTYDPHSVYTGADYLSDLSTIIANYRPDLIVYPNSEDVHPDHWGLNVFTRLAITLLRHTDPSYRPTELTYLVHRPDFPEIRGYKPQESLTPPDVIYALDPNWVRLDLTAADEARKAQAVQAYQSQLPLLRGLMESFIRTNEVFAPVTYPSLATISAGSKYDPGTWLDNSAKSIPPVQLDPAGDFITRSAVPAGDLTAVYMARDEQGTLQVCAGVQGETQPQVTYILRIKVLDAHDIETYQARTGRGSSGWFPLHRTGAYACASVTLADLGNPWAIYVGATTETGGRVMDETGWQMVYVKK